MNAEKVKELKWIPVKDWDSLSCSYMGLSSYQVTKKDFEDFVENLIRTTARNLNIKYADLAPVIKEENTAFYNYLNRIFSPKYSYENDSLTLQQLKKMLWMPDTTNVPVTFNESSVDKIINEFNSLSDDEKFQVLKRLGKVSVKVEVS